MFNKRSPQKELTDDLTLEGDASNENMQELAAVNFWLGGARTLISSFNKIYQKHSRSLKSQKTIIADLGCGGGDLLRAIHDWAMTKGLDVDLIGIDASPFVARRAAEESRSFANIQFKTADVLSDAFRLMRFDIVCLNSFCHHLSDADLITLLKRLRQQTRISGALLPAVHAPS